MGGRGEPGQRQATADLEAADCAQVAWEQRQHGRTAAPCSMATTCCHRSGTHPPCLARSGTPALQSCACDPPCGRRHPPHRPPPSQPPAHQSYRGQFLVYPRMQPRRQQQQQQRQSRSGGHRFDTLQPTRHRKQQSAQCAEATKAAHRHEVVIQGQDARRLPPCRHLLVPNQPRHVALAAARQAAQQHRDALGPSAAAGPRAQQRERVHNGLRQRLRGGSSRRRRARGCHRRRSHCCWVAGHARRG